MSLKNYIFQDCNDTNINYELIFQTWTGATGGVNGLDVGEIWEIEDSQGNNIEGCYNIVDEFTGNTYSGRTTDRFTGDTFTFVEYDSCEECSVFYEPPTPLFVPVTYYEIGLENCSGVPIVPNVYINQNYYDTLVLPLSNTYEYEGVCYDVVAINTENPVDSSELDNSVDILIDDSSGGLTSGSCDCGETTGDPGSGLDGGGSTTNLNCSFSVSAETMSNCNVTGITITIYDISANDGPYDFELNGQNILLSTESENGEEVYFTGITEGIYTITMFGDGCAPDPTQTIEITKNSPPYIVLSRPTSNCFDCDGTILLEYYNFVGDVTIDIYSGNSINSQFFVETFIPNDENSEGSNSIIITGLCGNQEYNIIVTDNQGCNAKEIIYFNSNTQVYNDFNHEIIYGPCGGSNDIVVSVTTNGNDVTYFLSGDTGILSAVTSNNDYQFNNVSNGFYYGGIITEEGCSGFTTDEPFLLSGDTVFEVIPNRTEHTECGQNNGVHSFDIVIEIDILPMDLILKRLSDNEIIEQRLDVYNINGISFEGLSTGTYLVDITADNGCQDDYYFTITGTSSITATIYGTNCQNSSNDGSAEIIVHESEGEVTYLWSNGETTPTIQNLSGGTYSVTITDENNCQLVKQVDIICNNEIIDNFILTTLCEQEFETVYNQQQTFEEIFAEICDGTNYIPTFSAVLTVTSIKNNPNIVLTHTFEPGIIDNGQWIDGVQELLDILNNDYDFIANTTIINNNSFIIEGICNEPELNNASVSLSIEVDCQELVHVFSACTLADGAIERPSAEYYCSSLGENINVPLYIQESCDLAMLADENGLINGQKLVCAITYHFGTQTPENVSLLDSNNDGSVSSADLLNFLGIYGSLNYAECSNYPTYIYGEGFVVNDGVYYIDEYETCYKYVGTEIKDSQTISITTLPNKYYTCQECQNGNTIAPEKIFFD